MEVKEAKAQEELTEEELESLLARCWLQKEKKMLTENEDDGTVACVKTTQQRGPNQ